jgi:hypothetical protein
VNHCLAADLVLEIQIVPHVVLHGSEVGEVSAPRPPDPAVATSQPTIWKTSFWHCFVGIRRVGEGAKN